jgi:hypothetical protein
MSREAVNPETLSNFWITALEVRYIRISFQSNVYKSKQELRRWSVEFQFAFEVAAQAYRSQCMTRIVSL